MATINCQGAVIGEGIVIGSDLRNVSLGSQSEEAEPQIEITAEIDRRDLPLVDVRAVDEDGGNIFYQFIFKVTGGKIYNVRMDLARIFSETTKPTDYIIDRQGVFAGNNSFRPLRIFYFQVPPPGRGANSVLTAPVLNGNYEEVAAYLNPSGDPNRMPPNPITYLLESEAQGCGECNLIVVDSREEGSFLTPNLLVSRFY